MLFCLKCKIKGYLSTLVASVTTYLQSIYRIGSQYLSDLSGNRYQHHKYENCDSYYNAGIIDRHMIGEERI